MSTVRKSTLTWKQIDVSKLNGLAKPFAAMMENRNTFESGFIEACRKSKQITDHETVKFSYRDGQLAIAKAPKSSAKAELVTDMAKLF